MLSRGIGAWNWSPARIDDRRARLIGFESAQELLERQASLEAAIEEGTGLHPADWRRVLKSTEMLFASLEDGLATDWSTFSDISDEASALVLRSTQYKISRWAQ